MSEQKTSKESWDGLLTNYLKADNIESEDDAYACIGVDVDGSEMNLDLERNEIKFVFSLNTTNKVFLKNNGITAPKVIIGKKIYFNKVKAFNPTLKKEVDSLRISRIE